MTLQEIADYAMDYLDGKGIAADYTIDDRHTDIFNHFTGKAQRISYKAVSISFLDSDVELNLSNSASSIRTIIDAHLTNSK